MNALCCAADTNEVSTSSRLTPKVARSPSLAISCPPFAAYCSRNVFSACGSPALAVVSDTVMSSFMQPADSQAARPTGADTSLRLGAVAMSVMFSCVTSSVSPSGSRTFEFAARMLSTAISHQTQWQHLRCRCRRGDHNVRSLPALNLRHAV